MKLFRLNYSKTYRNEVSKRLVNIPEQSILTESEIEYLPSLVKKYLHFSGAVGSPKVVNFRLVSNGYMKQGPKGKWLNILSQQYNFYNDLSRFFYIKSSLFHIPFDGLHMFIGKNATMQIGIAGFLQIVNAEGEKMNQSETVTLFNDICFFAPSNLINSNIQWEEIDERSVKAKFTNQGITISANLYFGKDGELINFDSEDRYLSADGVKYFKYKWSTPIKKYVESDGRKVCGYGEAIWHMPEGEYVYAKFYTKEYKINVGKFID